MNKLTLRLGSPWNSVGRGHDRAAADTANGSSAVLHVAVTYTVSGRSFTQTGKF